MDQDEHAHPMRLLREQAIRKAVEPGDRPFVPPPYSARDCTMLYMLCSFDPDAARKVLPDELELSEPVQGVIGLYTAGAGWAIGPFTAFYASLQVKGFDGPDGYPANYIHTGFFSGLAGEVMRKTYNRQYVSGSSRLSREGDVYKAEAGPDGRTAIRVTARHTDRIGPELAGVNHYLGRIPEGVTSYFLAYTTAFRDVEDVHIEISDAAPEPLRGLKPREVVWPLWINGMSITFSVPRLITASSEVIAENTMRAVLFDLLSRIGRPAAVVTRERRVVFLNAEAEAVLGADSRKPSLLSSARPNTRHALDGAVEHVIERRGPAGGQPIIVERPDGSPIVAHVLPISRMVASEPAALVLFTDPMRPGSTDPVDILRLLGLTAAEAKLAKLVGQGHSPREAADRLDITANTARSTLRDVYSKLAIGRQAELAQIVARLEMV